MAPERPNLVILITDQQRGDCLGIEGRKGLMTPNLDYLAASGARFTRAYSATPTCIAARRTLMSGQAPATHGLVGTPHHGRKQGLSTFRGKDGGDAMHSRYVERDAEAIVARYAGEGVPPDIARRIYTTRLLGQDPKLVRHVGPPCFVRDGLARPRCTEGAHFCGVPVWRSFPSTERRI